MEKSTKSTIVVLGGLVALGFLWTMYPSNQASTTNSKAANIINQFTERIRSTVTPAAQPTNSNTPESVAEVQATPQPAKIVWPDDSTIDWIARQKYLDKFGIDVSESPIPVYLPDPEVIGEGEVFWKTYPDDKLPWYQTNYKSGLVEFHLSSSVSDIITPVVAEHSANAENPDYQIGLEGGACLISWYDVGLSYHVTVSGQDAVSHDKALMFCESQESAAEFVRSLKYLGGQGH